MKGGENGGACRAGPQVRKSWPLKHLTRVEAFPSSHPDGRALAIEFWFAGSAFASEGKLAAEAHTPEELLDLLGTLYLFCRHAFPPSRHAGKHALFVIPSQSVKSPWFGSASLSGYMPEIRAALLRACWWRSQLPTDKHAAQ